MAQGDPRPRPYRNPSRISRLANPGNEGQKRQQAATEREDRDEATIKYIKRALCARPARSGPPGNTSPNDSDAKPLEELLPPLTSSDEVDVQLYAIIAAILSQFVQSWYNRITPDHDFVAEVVQIIAHCTRGLEQRLRKVDLDELLLDELPALLISHIDAVRVAQEACSGDRPPDDVRLIYHSIYPTEALTPLPDSPSTILEQEDNEVAWSQLLVSRILPLVLAPEDLQNPCLHMLVSEIFSEMIVHNGICGKASEAWLISEGVSKIIYSLSPYLNRQKQPADVVDPSPINRLEQFGLLSSAQARGIQDRSRGQRGMLDLIARVSWAALQFTAMFGLFLRSLVTALMQASSIPARTSHRGGKLKTSDRLPTMTVDPHSRPSRHETTIEVYDRRPVIDMRIWTCMWRLASLEQRMPWLSGFLSLLQWTSLYGPGKLCSTNSALDRVMLSQINSKLFRASMLPTILQAIRSAVFPDNTLAASRVPPTADEIIAIKRDAANAIVQLIPQPVRSRYFATKDLDLMRQDVESTLDLFADSFINKHLIISAVELIVVRLFPELGEEEIEQ